MEKSQKNYSMDDDGYTECPLCEGHGWDWSNAKVDYIIRCKLCHGKGKIDWVTYIMRKGEFEKHGRH